MLLAVGVCLDKIAAFADILCKCRDGKLTATLRLICGPGYFVATKSSWVKICAGQNRRWSESAQKKK